MCLTAEPAFPFNPPGVKGEVSGYCSKVVVGDYETDGPWWKALDPQVQSIIARLLEVDPDQRISLDCLY